MALFAATGSEQRAGEASPSYLRSRLAAQRIAELRADARIIAILREPVSFLHSLHMELMRDHAETETSLAKALALASERRAAEARGGAPGSSTPTTSSISSSCAATTRCFPASRCWS